MDQIDAAAATKILVGTAPVGAVEPTLKARRFIEQAARADRIHIEGFRGSAAVPEVIPIGHICALEFDWEARRSKTDHDLGEADLIAPMPTHGRSLACECVWLDLRFSRKEIEYLKADFAALVAGRRIEAPPGSQKQRKGRAPKREAVEKVLTQLYPTGVPDQTELPNKVLASAVAKKLSIKVDDTTILRAAGRK
jgi:hypothetical protein